MDSEKHRIANELVDKINDAKERIARFTHIKNLPPGQLDRRSVSVGSLGVSIDIPGRFLKKFSKQLEDALSQELEDLKTQYKEL